MSISVTQLDESKDEPEFQEFTFPPSSSQRIANGREIYLSPESKSVMLETLLEITASPYANSMLSDYLLAARKINQMRLPELEEARELLLGDTVPAVLIKNLPIDSELPATDTHSRDRKKTAISEAVCATLLAPLGRLAGYSDKRGGQVISDLYPKKSDKGMQLGSGSVFLEWHTDEAFHCIPPSFVCLYGLRGEPNAQTLVADFNLKDLPEDLRIILSSDLFRISADGSHTVKEQTSQVPIIKMERTRSIIRFDPIFTKSNSKEAQEALQVFAKIALQNILTFTISTGSALLFNNYRGIHARTEFAPRFDGTDRWINKAQTVPSETDSSFFIEGSDYLLKPFVSA